MAAYNEIFQNYQEKYYIRQVPKSEVVEQWFLPDFPVVKEERVTTKVCVVFDAAAKYDGECLNDTIWPGPKLVVVLTRFRWAPVCQLALSVDISEMFLQVELRSGNVGREWPLDRVNEAYSWDNGLVRVVKVKTKNTDYLCRVHRLCPLEYVEDSAEE